MFLHYKFDPDLDSVLQVATNEDLSPIVEYIKQANLSDGLTSSEEFIKFYPNHQHYVHILSSEIRTFGGHAVANFLRKGQGPDYRTVVCDVAKHMKLNIDEKADIHKIERQILAHVVKDMYDQMTEEQRSVFFNELRQYHIDDEEIVRNAVKDENLHSLNPKTVYFMSAIVASSVAKAAGISSLLATVGGVLSSSLSRIIAILGEPLGWLASAFYAAYDLGGPSYKVTVPCVLHIAMLRIKQSMRLLEAPKVISPDAQLESSVQEGDAQSESSMKNKNME